MNSILNVHHKFLSTGWYFLTTYLKKKPQKTNRASPCLSWCCFSASRLCQQSLVSAITCDVMCVILLLVDLSPSTRTCGCTSPTFPSFSAQSLKTVMNLCHLVKGQYCWSSHLPSRSARCYWGRQRLLFLIIACCQEPLVLECFSSGPLTGWGVSWRSCGSKVKEDVPCVPSTVTLSRPRWPRWAS